MTEDFFAGCSDEADRWDHAVDWLRDVWNEHDLTAEELVDCVERWLRSKGIDV